MPNNNDQEVAKIIAREGSSYTNDPKDRGGPTKFGITQSTLAWFRGHPVSPADVESLTLKEAQEIYAKRYILGPGFDKLPQGVLQSNLIDFGVMSGPQLAIMHLQEALGVRADGIIGPHTLTALQQASPLEVNKQLVARRCLMAARLCKKDPKQLAFLVGWLQRFLSFL